MFQEVCGCSSRPRLRHKPEVRQTKTEKHRTQSRWYATKGIGSPLKKKGKAKQRFRKKRKLTIVDAIISPKCQDNGEANPGERRNASTQKNYKLSRKEASFVSLVRTVTMKSMSTAASGRHQNQASCFVLSHCRCTWPRRYRLPHLQMGSFPHTRGFDSI